MASMFSSLGNAKIRMGLVMGVVVATVIAVIYFSQKKSDNVSGLQSTVRTARAPHDIQSVPGGKGSSKAYEILQRKANIQRANQAIKTGDSQVATILSSERYKGEQQAAAKKQTPPRRAVRAESPEEAYHRQLLARQREQREEELARLRTQANAVSSKQLLQQQKAMAKQAAALFKAWKPVAQSQVAGDEPEDDDARSAAGAGDADKVKPATLLKAGAILFATLDTEVNTDDGKSSPVMATVVSGQFKGAKLLGTVTRKEKKAILRFVVMNAPFLSSSLSISAVAVDPDSARAGLASEVNNHYLLRYGTLFASSFLSGVGKALLSSGSTQTNTSTNEGTTTTTSTHPEFSSHEQSLIGLGNVGEKLSDKLDPIFDKPPTVTVKSGTGIGVLILADIKQ